VWPNTKGKYNTIFAYYKSSCSISGVSGCMQWDFKEYTDKSTDRINLPYWEIDGGKNI